MDYTELLSEVKDAITVKRVYGDPIEKDGMTVIPVASVRGGGGGSGSGFGVSARPAGVYVIKEVRRRGSSSNHEKAGDVR